MIYYWNYNSLSKSHYSNIQLILKVYNRNLISHTPVEPKIVGDLSFEEVNQISNWKLEMTKKYGMTLEKVEMSLLHQHESDFGEEQTNFNDINNHTRKGK